MTHENDQGAALSAWRDSESFVLDLDIASVLVSPRRCLLRAPLSREVSTSWGAAALGLTVSLVDIAGVRAGTRRMPTRLDCHSRSDRRTLSSGSREVDGSTPAPNFRTARPRIFVSTHGRAHRVGPARRYGEGSRDRPDHSVVTLRLVEAGHGDRPVALATVLLQRP
jgi:hypothetical protein